MLSLIQDARENDEFGSRLWFSVTVGTWPSPFWLLWADNIWRGGKDTHVAGVGSARERWLNFRDAALDRALRQGPLVPMTAVMQHGLVWTRSSQANEYWPSVRKDRFTDFCIEVLTFFLAGTGLQELYVQHELMEARYWQFLAQVAAYARSHTT